MKAIRVHVCAYLLLFLSSFFIGQTSSGEITSKVLVHLWNLSIYFIPILAVINIYLEKNHKRQWARYCERLSICLSMVVFILLVTSF